MKTLSIVGRIGNRPRLTKVPPGADPLLTLQVAVADRERIEGQWRATVCWIDVIIVGELARKLVSVMRKGDLIAASGEMTTRNYQGRDTRDRTRIELRSTHFRSQEPRHIGEDYGLPSVEGGPV